MIDSIIFDEATHTYTLGGDRLPSVTQILSDCGLVDTTWFRAEHAERGTAVHNALDFYLDGDLDWDTVDESYKGYVDAGIKFIQEADLLVKSHEQMIFSAVHRYAGKVDLDGLYNGRPAVLDWKTGNPANVAAHIQLAGYADALYEMDKTIRDRVSVQLNKTGTYKLHPHSDRSDRAVFHAARTIYRAKHGI